MQINSDLTIIYVDFINVITSYSIHYTKLYESPFCPAVFGFKICQDIHDNLLKLDGIDDVKVNVSNHFMAEQINNQVT